MNSAQFQTEYLALAEQLYRAAFYMLESEAEAEDAVQEVYLKLWRSRDTLDGIRSPKAYSLTLVRNVCLDRIRRTRKEAALEAEPEIDSGRRPDEEMDSRERLAKVLAAIKSLPERQREVLMLRTWEDLSYDQIARRTGMNYLTLRVLLSRARQTLRKQL